jgi:dTDP-4-amino-4,6-dideoxygalactose transaminase
MINVTKTFFPPLDEYTKQLERIWKNEWLTNRGQLVLELEEKLKEYLSVSNILITNNGTIPLQIALKLLGNGGEIITTPFSYVATTAAIVWENCTPVFVDIHPEYLTIDESLIEAAITPKTTCILATHVFGNPCNVGEIDRIAKKYNLKVIYDAAHCFGVKYNGKSIFEYGDVSTCSFHATKLFHTGEGGAIFCKDKDLFDKISLSHSFGHIGDEYFQLGINGKMSELQAAMGLSVLPYMKQIIDKRKHNFDLYKSHFGDRFRTIRIREKTEYNYSYIPYILNSEFQLKQTIERLAALQVNARRYFFPSLNTLDFYSEYNNCPNSEKIAISILCLPNYFELSNSEIEAICSQFD